MHETPPGLTPLSGGFAGETFLADSGVERTVVRIYGERSAWRGPAAPEVDAAVLSLVRGLVPVPRVLEVRRGDPEAGAPGLLVTTLMPGENLQRRWEAGLSDDALAGLGHRLGRLVGRLAQMPMLRAGRFTDADLSLAPLPGATDGLVGWAEEHRDRGSFRTWPADTWRGLLEVADLADDLAERVTRACVVHSDLNPKNLLVDPRSLAVTALVDWEFAHAGSPYTDLGNLLRVHREPRFADAALAAYVDSGAEPDSTGAVLDQARAADLWALVDLSARSETDTANPVTDQAARLLRAIATARDLHAVPRA